MKDELAKLREQLQLSEDCKQALIRVMSRDTIDILRLKAALQRAPHGDAFGCFYSKLEDGTAQPKKQCTPDNCIWMELTENNHQK